MFNLSVPIGRNSIIRALLLLGMMIVKVRKINRMSLILEKVVSTTVLVARVEPLESSQSLVCEVVVNESKEDDVESVGEPSNEEESIHQAYESCTNSV